MCYWRYTRLCIRLYVATCLLCKPTWGEKWWRLFFDNYVSSIHNQIARQIYALRRIAKYSSIEKSLFYTLCLLAYIFSYCDTVRHLGSKRRLYELENAHKRALQVVLDDYTSSYNDLLNKMVRHTLDVTRLKAIATEAYESHPNEHPPYINAIDKIRQSNLVNWEAVHGQNSQNINTSYGLNTFSYQSAKLWNGLFFY